MLGIPVASVDAATSTTAVTGTPFAVPSSKGGRTIAWQSYFTGSPSAVSLALQGSLDNSNWSNLDTSTSTTGELKKLGPIAVNFVRATQVSRTGGTNSNVLITVW